MKTFLALIAALALSACASPSVQSSSPQPSAPAAQEQWQSVYLGANVTKRYSSTDAYLVLHDEIEHATGDVVLSQIRTGTISAVVLVDNIGGKVLPAQNIGYAIRYYGLSTGAFGECLSACVDIFVAGVDRVADGKAVFGIHSPSIIYPEGVKDDANYYYAMGVPQMLKATYSVPNNDMYYFGGQQAVTYGIATEIMY